MTTPEGPLSRYRFAVLSQARQNRVSVHDLPSPTLDFPEHAWPYLNAPKAYWEKEGPKLKDVPSIISVLKAIVESDRIELWCRPTTFFKFLWLNCALDLPLKDGRTFRGMYDDGAFGTLRKSCAHAHATKYTFPTFGNSLGITVVLISKDDHTIVTRRSETSPAITTNKGDWQCAVGSHVKRHQPRFLDEDDVPTPWRSAWEALLDEQGERVYRAIDRPPVCRGLVYRLDFHHCELVYEFHVGLEAAEIIEAWKTRKGLPSDANEVAVNEMGEFDIRAINARIPEPLLQALTTESWAPQHAAGALLVLAAHGFEREVRAAGLDLRLS